MDVSAVASFTPIVMDLDITFKTATTWLVLQLLVRDCREAHNGDHHDLILLDIFS